MASDASKAIVRRGAANRSDREPVTLGTTTSSSNIDNIAGPTSVNAGIHTNNANHGSTSKRVTRTRKTGGASGAGGSTELPAFVRKLWDMVDSPSTDEYIHWTADGQSFEVVGREQFERVVLPQYFKHNNFSSFVRQLNMYGWHKVQDVQSGAMHSNDETWRFKSDNFVRGRKDLLYNIVRNKGPAKPGSDEDEEVDFNRVLDELSVIRNNQRAIGEDLFRIKKDNEMLWHENVQSRERYKKHAETLERILRFLASLYGNQGRLLSDIMSPIRGPGAGGVGPGGPYQRLLTAGGDDVVDATSSALDTSVNREIYANAHNGDNFGFDADFGQDSGLPSGLSGFPSTNNNNINSSLIGGSSNSSGIGAPDLKDRIFSISSANSPTASDTASPKSSQVKVGGEASTEAPTPAFSDYTDTLSTSDVTPGHTSTTRPRSAASSNRSKTATPAVPVSGPGPDSKALATLRPQQQHHQNIPAGFDANKLLMDLAQYGAQDQQQMTDRLVNSTNDIDRISRNIDTQELSLQHFQELLQNHLRHSDYSNSNSNSNSPSGRGVPYPVPGSSEGGAGTGHTPSATIASPDQFKLEDFLVDPQDGFHLDQDPLDDSAHNNSNNNHNNSDNNNNNNIHSSTSPSVTSRTDSPSSSILEGQDAKRRKIETSG